jgi:hypothetical protein
LTTVSSATATTLRRKARTYTCATPGTLTRCLNGGRRSNKNALTLNGNFGEADATTNLQLVARTDADAALHPNVAELDARVLTDFDIRHIERDV